MTRPCLFVSYKDLNGEVHQVSFNSSLEDRYHYAETVGFVKALSRGYITSDEVIAYKTAYALDISLNKEV